MEWYYMVITAIAAAAVIVGSFFTAYQLYRLVQLDAECRGLKHPKFWGAFTLTGNSASGLIVYLIGRRRYPIVSRSAAQRELMARRKKRLGVSLVFQAAGAILCVLGMLLGNRVL